MRGILWRWLLFFGTIFWISLCVADYHQTYLQKSFKQTMKNMDLKLEPPQPSSFFQMVPKTRKLQPPTPALTFWKFLSIVLSVSAIVIIKRLSTFRKKSLPVTTSDFDLIRAPYGAFITRIPPISHNPFSGPIYHQEFQVARMESASGDNRPPALVGVKIVQKKLEDLENNIATLKQRISSNSSSNPTSLETEPVKKVFERKLAANQSYFGPIISNTDTQSSLSSNPPQSSEAKTRKEILINHSRAATPCSPESPRPPGTPVHPATPKISEIPSTPRTKTLSENCTPDKSSKRSATSARKEVKFSRKSFEIDNDIISLKDLKDSMSGHTHHHQTENKPSDTKTSSTFPSISSRKSGNESCKSFPLDGTSSKIFTDSNTTTSTLTSMRKKRFLKSIKGRKKPTTLSPSIAAYLTPFHSASFPHSRKHDGSYASINRKKKKILKELRANSGKYDISSSSNDSTDSIDKFVAKILKPESDILVRHSSDEMSMDSTSVSSLAASSSTFISGGGNAKIESTNSIRSVLPLSRTTVSSNFSSLGNSRNMPAGAEPLSSGESMAEKSCSKYGNNMAIHSLAVNYLQNLDRNKSQDKIHDSGSEFSFTTKSVLEKYKSKTTRDCSNASSRQNILEDKYWLLHW